MMTDEKCPKCGAEFLKQTRDGEYTTFKCGTDWKSHYGACQSDKCRIRELEAELAAAREEIANAYENDRLVAEMTGCKIVCREGGGPENLQGTLTLSVNRLKHDYDKAREEIERLTAENIRLHNVLLRDSGLVLESQRREAGLMGLLMNSSAGQGCSNWSRNAIESALSKLKEGAGE